MPDLFTYHAAYVIDVWQDDEEDAEPSMGVKEQQQQGRRRMLPQCPASSLSIVERVSVRGK